MTHPVSATPESLPNPELIALLAVQLMCRPVTLQGRPTHPGMEPDEAVKLALAVWCEAVAQVRSMPSKTDVEFDSTLLPAKFPASIDEFIRIVVPGRSEGTRIARFKRFLRGREHLRQAVHLRELRTPSGGIPPLRVPIDEVPEIGIEQGGALLDKERRSKLRRESWIELARGFAAFERHLRDEAGKAGARARWKKV